MVDYIQRRLAARYDEQALLNNGYTHARNETPTGHIDFTKRSRSGGDNLPLQGGVLLQVLAVFAVDGAGHDGAQHMVHLAHSRVCRALEEHQALLQQAAVPHLRGNQVGLVPISLLYNALHVGWIQDLQDRDRLGGSKIGKID